MSRDLNQNEISNLEALMDTCSVQSVLMALSEICEAKADHIIANYNDKFTAKQWQVACGAIGVIVSNREISAISR